MNGKRVLVVDDGMTMRLFCREVLEGAGFDIEEAGNGIEGIERALVGSFDLLLVDINMPKMDGYEMIRLVHEDPGLRAVPVVTISSEAREADIERAYQAGANYYIVKLMRPGDLARTARLLTGVRAP